MFRSHCQRPDRLRTIREFGTVLRSHFSFGGPAAALVSGKLMRCRLWESTRASPAPWPAGGQDMTTNTTNTDIRYEPSPAARVARKVLPPLRELLPSTLFDASYELLYASYKKALRLLYLRRVLGARLSGDRNAVLKTSLTYDLLPYTMGGSKALENAFQVVLLANQRRIPGALVECGVAEGGTAAMMALSTRHLSEGTRRKWLFDSFEGLPDPTDMDYEGGKLGEFIRPLPKGACLGTIEQVSELLFEKLRVPREEVSLVKGWFQDTVPAMKEDIGPISVLRLDGDWYESTKIPLNHLYDQVTPGGFIIIDDYATCHGSRRAVEEFRSERGLTSPLIPDGRGGVWFEKPIEP